MGKRTMTKGRMALIAIPAAGALMLGAGGYAWAAGTATGPGQGATTTQSTVTHQSGTGASASGPDKADLAKVDPGKDATDGNEKNDSSEKHDAGDKGNNDKPTYTSSVKTAVKDDSGNEAANDLAVAKLAKIGLGEAAQKGAGAVSGGTAVGVELENEGGNVVYQVDVVTQTEKHEVIVDAGNGNVLANTVDHEDSGD